MAEARAEETPQTSPSEHVPIMADVGLDAVSGVRGQEELTLTAEPNALCFNFVGSLSTIPTVGSILCATFHGTKIYVSGEQHKTTCLD